MAAETIDFDSSFDSEHREDGIDRMIGDVLEDSFEEIPEATDEFWKPVISVEANMSRQQPVEITESASPLDSVSEKVEKHHAARSQDEYPLPVRSIIDNNCTYFDEGVQFLRRSKSEDILCKNQTDHQPAYYESYPIPMQQNYVTTPDKISNLSDSLSSVEGTRPSDNFLLGDKGFKSFFDEYDKKLDYLEVKHTAIDDSFNDMQSILMEFENFVSFIEHQYIESIEPAEKKSDDPSDDVADAGNKDKKAEDDTDQCADTPEICEEDRIEEDPGGQIDKCESGEDLKENDINKSVDITDNENISAENHDEISEENEENVPDKNTDRQTEERLQKKFDEEEKELCNGDNKNEQNEKSKCEMHVQRNDCQDDPTKCDLAMDMRSFLMCLNSSLHEMFTRFQNFVTEVGETVHLGALATQHSQRMDSWASHVQRLYNSLKTDHNNMQEYIELREKDWIKVRSQLQAELETQGHQIHEVITALKEHEDVRRKSERNLSKRVGERLLRKSERSKSLDKLDNNLVDILQKRRCDQEQAMALDFSRQLKITELKLILVRQQSYIQRLELQNKELDGVLRGVLFDPDTEQFSGNYFVRNPAQIGEGFNTMTDILHCDKANYLPGKSTDPDMVASQTFDIGPKTQRLSAEKEVMFDPKMLKYMCRETAAAINTDMDEIGSGEKVKQECEMFEGEAGNLNNSRVEKTSQQTVTQAEPTELVSGPHLDVNGNINLSMI
ncbi:uncharacterized protein LOC110457642 [Mizuhopecten yessoensis]|nr:uncharacterized protein LOC110457642 [Mizuhopecten yessoensis]